MGRYKRKRVQRPGECVMCNWEGAQRNNQGHPYYGQGGPRLSGRVVVRGTDMGGGGGGTSGGGVEQGRGRGGGSTITVNGGRGGVRKGVRTREKADGVGRLGARRWDDT